jgi:hypothetical protein
MARTRLRVRIPLMRGALDTTLCDKVCQWLASVRWFSPGTPVFSTNKIDRHNIISLTPRPLRLFAICFTINGNHLLSRTQDYEFRFVVAILYFLCTVCCHSFVVLYWLWIFVLFDFTYLLPKCLVSEIYFFHEQRIPHRSKKANAAMVDQQILTNLNQQLQEGLTKIQVILLTPHIFINIIWQQKQL